jgi:diguanylate cyclase (GGDEF)-like protein/PAS domain S-box-containing protein
MELDDVISQLASLTIDAIGISVASESGEEETMVWVNDAFCDVTGWSREAILNHDIRTVLHHPGYVGDYAANVRYAREHGTKGASVATMCLREDGSEFWANVRLTFLPSSGGKSYTIASIRDIDILKSREQAAEIALIENEGLLTRIKAAQTCLVSAINTTPDAFAIFGASGKLEIWNPAFAEFTTSRPDLLKPGTSYLDVVNLSRAEDRACLSRDNEEDWLTRQLQRWNDTEPVERIVASGDRQYRVTQTVTPDGDRVLHCVDISEFLRQQQDLRTYTDRLERANDEIRHQAMHDELTGLGNRRYFNEKLEEWIARRQAMGGEIAALHIDLDRFKQINDTMGHATGDRVLTVVADRLRARLRGHDIVARIGGDEFIVLIERQPDSQEPVQLAERLIRDLCEPMTIGGRNCVIGASIGVAQTPMVEARELVACSDIALYKAKEGGRSKAAMFDIADLDRMRVAKRLGDDILRGVSNGEFCPVYQPQVDAVTGRTVALEVLARWRHPVRGMLEPAAFLAAAVELKMDREIDRMVFRTATEECANARAEDGTPPALAFNVGAARLMDGDVMTDVADNQYPGQIVFELLETIFLEDATPELTDRLNAFRLQGVSLEVDDFGSGRASIVGLQRVAPDRLKIDRRLVAPVAEAESSRKLVHAIVDIGRALGIGVTLEGVETEAQAQVLRDLGCDRFQGHFFSRPVPLAWVPGLDMAERRAAAAEGQSSR